jgi:DNA repair protein RadC
MTRYRVRRIADMLASDRPRERLARAGSRSLGDAELLAILLGTGNSRQSALDLAQSLLARVKGLDGLQRMSFAELCTWEGIGPAKAAQIMAAGGGPAGPDTQSDPRCTARKMWPTL